MNEWDGTGEKKERKSKGSKLGPVYNPVEKYGNSYKERKLNIGVG